jgi:hypothetical protein
MTLIDVAAIVFVILGLLSMATAIALIFLSRTFPDISALRERRNIAIAIALSVTLVSFLAVNSRLLHITLDPGFQTLVLIVALGAPPLVNTTWLVGVFKWMHRRRAATVSLAMPEFKDDGSARSELQHAIMNVVTQGLAGYYIEHPDRLDRRADEAAIVTQAGLTRVAHLLDEYSVARR